jgi:radical SAM protein with 4Fe4S-binding SPASM domain
MKKITGFWLSPSYKCNNLCDWCYAGNRLSLASEARFEDLKMYIDKMVQAGAKTCVLVGGEPSIYPLIFDLISYTSKKGLSVRMMSNGRKLSSYDFVLRLKDSGLDYCSVSIEGPEKIHDQTTKVKGSFGQSFQGILNCQKAGLPVNSITTISAINRSYLDDLLISLQRVNLQRAVFNMCSSQPSGYHDQDVATIDLVEYARIVERIGLQYDFVCFYALVPLCLYDQKKLQKLINLNRLKIACSLFSDTVSIDPQGFLLPCNHMADLNYGNINEPGAIGRLLLEKGEDKKFLSANAPSIKCVNCTLWNKCHGGCNLIWFSRNAQDYIPGIQTKEEKGG